MYENIKHKKRQESFMYFLYIHNCLYIKTVVIWYHGNNEIDKKDSISKVSNALNLCLKLTCIYCGSVVLDEWRFDPWCLVVFLPSFSNLLSEMSPSAERNFHGSLRKLSSCMAHSFSLTHSLYTFVWQQNASGSTVTSDNSIAGRNKLDVLKNKARSSLTSSLENIFSRVCVCVLCVYILVVYEWGLTHLPHPCTE